MVESDEFHFDVFVMSSVQGLTIHVYNDIPLYLGDSKSYYLWISGGDQPLQLGKYIANACYCEPRVRFGLTYNVVWFASYPTVFEILDLKYATDGSVSSFAANFAQFDDQYGGWAELGSIRYRSSVPLFDPVPEPSSLLLTGLSIGIPALLRQRFNLN